MVKNSMVKEKTLLLREIKILSLLKNKQGCFEIGLSSKGFTQIKAYGSDDNNTFFLMDLLGENLESLRSKYDNFTIPTLINTAIQMIDRIESKISFSFYD